MDDPDFIAHPLDFLIGYTPGMKLPQARNERTRQWHPEDAFAARPTEDEHWRWIACRTAGWRWHRLTCRIQRGITNQAHLDRGRRLVRRCIAEGSIDMSDVEHTKDAERVENALGYCAGLVVDTAADHKHRLSAATTLLSFLKVKPTTKVEQTIRTAEDFLDALDE